MIDRLYAPDGALKDSIILGVYSDNAFCGIAELYGHRASANAATFRSRPRDPAKPFLSIVN